VYGRSCLDTLNWPLVPMAEYAQNGKCLLPRQK